MCNKVTTKSPAKNELLSLLQIVNFDSDELYEELNQSAESESEEERDHRHSFNPFYRRHSGQDRKRRRRPRSNSHFLVGDDKVSLFYYSIVSHFYERGEAVRNQWINVGLVLCLNHQREAFRGQRSIMGTYVIEATELKSEVICDLEIIWRPPWPQRSPKWQHTHTYQGN